MGLSNLRDEKKECHVFLCAEVRTDWKESQVRNYADGIGSIKYKSKNLENVM